MHPECAMPSNARLRLVRQVQIAKALGHPSPTQIVEEIRRRGELCVCEITRSIGADASRVARHLAVLRSEGILVDDKRDQQVFYRLRT